MHALIAIDSFKNSITSIHANQLVAKQFAAHGITTTQVAIADGGEGTVAAWLANHAGGQAITASTVDLAQRPLTAMYGYFAAEKMAVIEVAAASGIQFVTPTLTPLVTNTYGTGMLIKDAIERGARKIILGLGGSGTVDGGAGILRALGYRFMAADGQELDMTGADLSRVTRIDDQDILPQLAGVTFISAADVTNPLTGPNGAAKIFGPQKGLPADHVQAHDSALAHYMTVASGTVSAHEGDGAAGGIGFALRYFLHAQVQSGFQLLATMSQLKTKVAQADLVISGEGQVDDQSFMGKVPIQLSQLAQTAGKPCYLLVGRQKGTNETFAKQGVTAVLPIVDQVMTLDQAMAQGPANLERMADRLARIISCS